MSFENPLANRLKHPDCFFIGGAWTKPSHSDSFTLVCPTTELPIGQIAMARREDVVKAVDAARRAFDNGPWPRYSHAERAACMNRLAGELAMRADALARAWTDQIGAPFSVASALTPASIATYNYYAGMADDPVWEEDCSTVYPGHRGIIVREPVGVVAAIVPWNGPLFALTSKLAPGLIAGCTFVVKPSPETPLEAYMLAECVEAAGFPPGVVNVIAADREVSESLVQQAGVDKVSFTGSTAAGKRIGAICAERVARVTLELGGKSAAIILDDYDLDAAAAELAPSLCLLSGQVCANLTRYLVPQKKHDRFVDLLADHLRAIKLGDPYAEGTQMGPLAMKRQLERVEHFVAIGIEEGNRLITGGRRPTDLERGYYFEPTLFANVDNRSKLAQQEIFGPVVTVTPYTDVDHAAQLANESDFGLNGAVFTNDPDLAYAVARRIRTGTVGQNGSRTDFSIGFGGFKQSGIGREGGRAGIFPYVESKTIVLNATRNAEV